MDNDAVSDDDIKQLAEEAVRQGDERLRRVCMAALTDAWAKTYNIRSDFARDQCERVIREQREHDARGSRP